MTRADRYLLAGLFFACIVGVSGVGVGVNAQHQNSHLEHVLYLNCQQQHVRWVTRRANLNGDLGTLNSIRTQYQRQIELFQTQPGSDLFTALIKNYRQAITSIDANIVVKRAAIDQDAEPDCAQYRAEGPPNA